VNPTVTVVIDPLLFAFLRLMGAATDSSTMGGSHRSSPSVDTFHPDSQIRIPQELISLEAAKDARLRRTNVVSGSPVEKTVIKGTMAKVVTASNGLHYPLTRMLHP
jgi:hypothetical protein